MKRKIGWKCILPRKKEKLAREKKWFWKSSSEKYTDECAYVYRMNITGGRVEQWNHFSVCLLQAIIIIFGALPCTMWAIVCFSVFIACIFECQCWNWYPRRASFVVSVRLHHFGFLSQIGRRTFELWLRIWVVLYASACTDFRT